MTQRDDLPNRPHPDPIINDHATRTERRANFGQCTRVPADRPSKENRWDGVSK